MSELRENQLVVQNAIISYPHIFQPFQFPGDKKVQYSAKFILPADFDFTRFMAAIEDACNYKWGANRPQGLAQPFSQVNDPDSPYNGRWQFSAKRVQDRGAPSVVDQNVQPLLQPDLIPSGSRVNVMIDVWAYDTAGNRGTSTTMNIIQLVQTAGTGDLPTLASQVKAEDVFQPVAGAPAPTAPAPGPAAAPQAAPAPSSAPAPAPAPAAAPAPAPAPGTPPGFMG